jgi:hypothetical protein
MQRRKKGEERLAILYDHGRLARPVDEGGKVSRSGLHVVRPWAKDGISISLKAAPDCVASVHIRGGLQL